MRTGIKLGEGLGSLGSLGGLGGLGGFERFDVKDAIADLEGKLHRIGEARTVTGKDQPVDDDIDRVRLLLVQLRNLFEEIRLAVDPHAHETIAP